MPELIEDLNGLWDIVVDLVTYYYDCCSLDMPYDEGEIVEITRLESFEEVLKEMIEDVCTNNNVQIPQMNADRLKCALSIKPIVCPECGHQLQIEDEIGKGWWDLNEVPLKNAHHILNRSYWSFLTHYTRSTPLLSELEVLNKISTERTLNANNYRDYDVVCLTECCPLEIEELSQVSPGQNSYPSIWKRSKYGVAMNRKKLISFGAMPAIHGDNALFTSLPETEKWRFMHFNAGQPFSDWTMEREFRFNGNLSLNLFQPEDVVFIVSNKAEKFKLLSQRDVFPYAVMVFNELPAKNSDFPKITARQKLLRF